jgi:capsular polysaccharide transport system permease protein
MNIKHHFQSSQVDSFSRLKKNPTQKEFLAYYQKKIASAVDPITNELNISVRAFSAQEAQSLLTEIIHQSKSFVNRVSNIMAEKQYHFAAAQLKLAKEKLFLAEKKALQFQNTHGTFNPKHTAEVVASVLGQLKAKLVEKQTELITYSSYMQPGSSKIVALKEEINAIKDQMQNQTNDLLSNHDKSAKLNQLLIGYEWQELQLKFSQAEYEASQQAYDIAKINLAKQQHLVIEISPPNLPDTYEYPKILYDLINIFVVLMIFFVLGKMAIIIIQEHTY